MRTAITPVVADDGKCPTANAFSFRPSTRRLRSSSRFRRALKITSSSTLRVRAARRARSRSTPRLSRMRSSVTVSTMGRYSQGPFAAEREPPPGRVRTSNYLRLAIAVRSNLPVATKVAPHQLNPPGLIAVKSPVKRAVWSLVKALQSPLP